MIIIPCSLSAQTEDSVSVSCVIVRSQPELSISVTSLSYLQYVNKSINPRFNLQPLTCEFSTPHPGWEIHVYHTNGVANHALRGENSNNYLPVKIWQPNYGPTNYYSLGLMPPVTDETVWHHNLRWVGDKLNTEGISQLASHDDEDRSPLTFNFAIDATYATETSYYGQVFFDMIVP